MQRMQLADIRELVSDEEGVSPVIGVILMVAITVILAAVIGTFVLGLGNQVTGSTAPTADFGFDFNPNGNDYVEIVHNGGDKIEQDLTVHYTDQSSSSQSTTWSGAITAGDSFTTSSAVQHDSTVRVTWSSEGGGSSQTLATFDVPAA